MDRLEVEEGQGRVDVRGSGGDGMGEEVGREGNSGEEGRVENSELEGRRVCHSSAAVLLYTVFVQL